MNGLVVALFLLVLLSLGYQVGVTRGRAVAASAQRSMHSRPSYHGLMVALWCAIPALLILLLWTVFADQIALNQVRSLLPAELLAGDPAALRDVMRRIEQIASGFGVVGETQPYEVAAGEALRSFRSTGFWTTIGVAALFGLLGLLLMARRIAPRLRARNEFEGAVRVLLIACSAVAILTTVGIVASLLSEAARFFTFVSPVDFFFGTVWNPGFSTTGDAGGQYGLLPLLWGTIMVSAIAMAVAIPVGLLSAIYMAEYADRRVRAVAKPVIEILAGIPSVIYGVFALITLGPLLSALGALVGIQIRATSALTAGIAMGLMIVPFVSSLSDDIITQVPRALRDGSLGIGATKSETIRRVVLPAALPGIVGAFMLAISKAFGETMIVVLAAGNAPVLRANPFDAVSTVTVSIVNQLTGDTNFASPQALVAFALGLTLFIMTLILNVIALYVVRKYREQHE